MSLEKWMQSGKYLPPFLRDFHDQKDVFKAIHTLVNKNEGTKRVNWVDGQIYVIDVFLWFMARRGWTLQRSRKDVEFVDLDKTVSDVKAHHEAAFYAMMKNNSGVSVNTSSTPENQISPSAKPENTN